MINATLEFPGHETESRELQSLPAIGAAISGPILVDGSTWKIEAIERNGDDVTVRCGVMPPLEMIYGDNERPYTGPATLIGSHLNWKPDSSPAVDFIRGQRSDHEIPTA